MEYKTKISINEIIPMNRLVQIVVATYGRLTFPEIVEHVSELTREYYRCYYPPEQNLKNLVSKALRVMRAYGKVRRVKRGVWEITISGLLDLVSYHKNVKEIPEEIMPYNVKALLELSD